MSRDLDQYIREHLKHQEMMRKAMGIDSAAQLSEDIKRVNEVMKTLKLPESFKTLAQTMAEFSREMNEASKTIAAQYNIGMSESMKVLQGVLTQSMAMPNISNIRSVLDMQVSLLKYLQTEMPDRLALPFEDNEDEVDYVTREDLQEVITGFQQQIAQMDKVTDIKWFIQYVVGPMMTFITIVTNILIYYQEIEENVERITSQVEKIVEEFGPGKTGCSNDRNQG